MKNCINLLKTSLLGLVLLGSLSTRAGDDPMVEKTKTYTKTYALASGERLSVSNQFGEVKINGWNRNEVKVDVTIIAKASNDERAQHIIERISIEDGKNGDGVYFKTNMKNDHEEKHEKNDYKEQGMKINYQVYMPTSNPLVLSNQFGASIVPDMTGTVDLTSKFGSLTAGRLSNVKKIDVEFGTATIESISGGQLSIKFSRAVVNKLDGSVSADFEHCSGIKLVVDNNTKQLIVASSFTTLLLDVNKNLSATVDISTSFGGLNNKTDFEFKEAAMQSGKKSHLANSYSGKFGSGSSSLKIASSFSQVTLGHNLTMDLKETRPDKKKTTTS